MPEPRGRQQGLYGAGQDLLIDSFSGNVRGWGRPWQRWTSRNGRTTVSVFLADKTDPGAYNLPLYLAFADAMNTPGLILSPKISKGFRFVFRM